MKNVLRPRPDPFRVFWAGNIAATTGSETFRFAIGIIAVSTLMASPIELGVLGAATFVGILLLSPIAGAVADRHPRRTVLLLTVLARVILVASVPVAFAVDAVSMWFLIAIVAAVSVVDAFYDAAHFSIVTDLVPRADVATAIGRLQTTDQVARIAVPAAVGVALRVVSAPVIVLASAALQSIALLLFSGVPRSRVSVATEHPPFWVTVREGIGFIRRHIVIRTFMISSSILNLAAGVVVSVFTLYALQTLGLSTTEYGIAMGVGAVGGVVAGLVAARVGDRVGQIRTMMIGAAGVPLAYVVLLLAAVLPVAAVVPFAISELLFSFLILLYGIQNAGLSARVTPSAMMGRVASARRLVAVGSFPVGSLIGGALAQWIGVYGTLAVALAISLFITVPVFASGLSRHAFLPEELVAAGEPAAG